jgi:hypothetical protein
MSPRVLAGLAKDPVLQRDLPIAVGITLSLGCR